MSAGAVMVDPSASSGAGGSTGSGAGGQGGGETVTVTGDAVRVDSLAFDNAVAYAKPATISAFAYGASGQQISQPYNGVKFTIDGVTKGENWFFVAPMDTTDTVFPTYSLQVVDTAKLVLPLIDTQVLTTIGLDAGLALSTLEAQIVIFVSHGGQPLKGISATSAGAGLILYDFGPEAYSIQGKVTGDRGVIVLLNQSTTSITLTDPATMTTYHPVVRPDAGTATLMALEL
jgi:hypothetical protein